MGKVIKWLYTKGKEIPQDKLIHFCLYGTVVTLFLNTMFLLFLSTYISLVLALAVSVVYSVIKELFIDSKIIKGTPEVADALYGIAGAIFAAGCLYINIIIR